MSSGDQKLVTLSVCNLNQWALDFQGNQRRIIQSIEFAREQGSRYRLGPELEVSGYSCEDHFLEVDTFLHCWEVIGEILRRKQLTTDLLCDIGMAVLHKGVRYNCRVYILNAKIVFIRPKQFLANDGNYRELRYFHAWTKRGQVESHRLPLFISDICGQQSVMFGDAAISTVDSCLAHESCEELFTPNSPNISMYLDGIEVIGNGSASHHQLRKLDQRIQLISNATAKAGGVYLYSNMQGCDGTRLYFDGTCMIFLNGEMLAQGSQFALDDVEVVSATINLDDVQSYRGQQHSRGIQASQSKNMHRIHLDWRLTTPSDVQHEACRFVTRPIEPRFHTVEEEIALGPACWLWDYLRRSGLGGFFLPLSGGADSAATATIVGSMCQMVTQKILHQDQGCVSTVHQGSNGIHSSSNDIHPSSSSNDIHSSSSSSVLHNPNSTISTTCRAPYQKSHASMLSYHTVLQDVRNITNDPTYCPISHQELAHRLLYTCFMGTKNSSKETTNRAAQLASEIGSNHRVVQIDAIYDAFLNTFSASHHATPKFKAYGGSEVENLALQNIQARSRMVYAYISAQLSQWANKSLAGSGKSLLVLGSSNVDEALRGYYTKYDCSAADINPIGSISKIDLKRFLIWASKRLDYPSLAGIVNAPPTAELEPITTSYTQTDEQDMGMTYQELSYFGTLRKIYLCGPLSMFQKLISEWDHLKPSQVAHKVKYFFKMYAINRHKMTTLTPSYHAESYSPDDNRHDLRPFLYPRWQHQFAMIDQQVALLEKNTLVLEKNSSQIRDLSRKNDFTKRSRSKL